MTKKAEFTLQGMLIGILGLGLFFGLIAGIVGSMSNSYDSSNIDLEDLKGYTVMPNISETIDQAAGQVDKVTVDKSAFDFFSEIWNKLTSPFKFLYRSFGLLKTILIDATSELGLLKVISDYLVALLTVLVIIGIVLIKFYLGKQK